MIRIFNNTNNNSFPLSNVNNLYCESSEGGNKSICFDISPKDEQYKLLSEEIRLEYNNLYYIVKKINERKTVSSIEAELDLDSLKTNAYFEYTQSEVLLSELLDNCLSNTGWTTIDANLISHRHTLELTNVNTLDIINKASEIWGCAFSFDNKNKVIDCIDIEAIQPSGVYFTDELNLKSIEFKGDSSDFCTRLKCRGAKDDEENYLTFESINDGKDYVENFDYCDKIITKTWIDERYTNKQSLKDDAIEKLKLLAIPSRSYNCTLMDLSKVDSKYSDMGINLYDKVILVDRQRKTRVLHRVVKLKEFDKSPLNNIITLSSIQASLTGKINTISTLLDNAGDIAVDGVCLNEFKRDINTNSLEISKRYTKGETDTVINSKILQSESEIMSEVSETYSTKNETTTQISSAVTQTKDDITLDFKNGGLASNVVFDATGEKIYNGNFEIYNKPLSDSTKKMIFGTDANGNLGIAGYLTQFNGKTKLLAGNNNNGNAGVFIYETRNAYKKSDGSYQPYCEIWSTTNNNTVVSGVNGIALRVTPLDTTYQTDALTCFIERDYPDGSYYYGGYLHGSWYLSGSELITSDRNKKNTINNLADKYSVLFDNLQPVTYKYNDGTSNRLHTGFISQDVEQALTDSNLTSNEFAGFAKDKDGNYYLRYEEFIALNTNEIQKLKTKVNTLEDKLNEQQKQIEELKALVLKNNVMEDD